MSRAEHNLIRIGQVLKSNGTDGEVVMGFRDIDPVDIDLEEPVFIRLDDTPVPFFIESFTLRGNSKAIVRLTDIRSGADAEEITGHPVYAEAESLGELSELILVAQDTTRYGEDLYGENRFVHLIRSLSSLDNIKKLRLLYCYPDVIGDALIDEIASNDKVLKYIDIPLQHSEGRILKLMNRKGSRAGYLSLLAKLRERVPGIAVRSTFIAGFPTETEEECAALADFLREAELTNAGFFAYSREPDTAAYRLKGQIPARIKQSRVKMLYKVQEQISARFLRGFVGGTLPVLCDGIDYESGCFAGRAAFSAPEIDGKVYFRAPFAEQGEVYEVKITDAGSYDLFGHTEDYV